MGGMFKADHEVLQSASNNLVNHIGDYRATVDHMVQRTHDVASHAIVGPMGMALENKMEEYHQAATQFLDHVEDISHNIGKFSTMAEDQESENQNHADGIDIHFS